MTWIGITTTLSLKRKRASGSCSRTLVSSTKCFFTGSSDIEWNPPPPRRGGQDVLLDGRQGLVELHDVAYGVAGVDHRARRGPQDEPREGSHDARDLPAEGVLDD